MGKCFLKHIFMLEIKLEKLAGKLASLVEIFFLYDGIDFSYLNHVSWIRVASTYNQTPAPPRYAKLMNVQTQEMSELGLSTYLLSRENRLFFLQSCGEFSFFTDFLSSIVTTTATMF